MITWAERAKAAISQKSQNGTVKTDETPVLSGLAVDAEAVSVMAEGLSSVLSVPSPGYFENLQGARQETQAAVVSLKSHRHGATETTETAERKAQPSAVSDDELDRQLLDAAMRCCDYWNDSAQARAQMVADIRATPQHHCQELLEHFQQWYGKPK